VDGVVQGEPPLTICFLSVTTANSSLSSTSFTDKKKSFFPDRKLNLIDSYTWLSIIVFGGEKTIFFKFGQDVLLACGDIVRLQDSLNQNLAMSLKEESPPNQALAR